MTWPTVIYTEEIMREGFGIARPHVATEVKAAFLERLSETGLKRISVGAFVSPRFVPQMADFEALLKRFRPTPGVTYLPFTHNRKAREMAEAYSPPLTLEEEMCTLFLDICDVHQRRNVNRSIEQIVGYWPDLIADARARGIKRGRVAIASAYGSNFMGKFGRDYRFAMLEREMAALADAGIEAVEIGLHDSQSWCLPHEVAEDLREIRRRWPDVRTFHLHLHNARGMAMASLVAALETLGEGDTLLVDGTLGGIGGGQYCGNGIASAMVATEDFMHLLEGLGIDTGVDLGRVIDCVWTLEEIVGHQSFGHVSKAGPRPGTSSELYDPNLPAIESLKAARHFRLGAEAYAGEGYSPWREPIAGPYLTPRSILPGT